MNHHDSTKVIGTLMAVFGIVALVLVLSAAGTM